MNVLSTSERGLLFDPGDVIDVRMPGTRAGVVGGYFGDDGAMAAATETADAKYRVCYLQTLVDSALLRRAHVERNLRITESLAGPGEEKL